MGIKSIVEKNVPEKRMNQHNISPRKSRIM